MRVEVWSDVACPWCYIGKRRLETALRGFEHRDRVEVIWRSFELDPAAPARRPESPRQHLARKYGTSLEQADQMNERMAAAAAGEGLAYRLGELKMGNTFDAHRLLHLAAEHGIQDRVKERLLAGYLCEEEAIGDRDTLARLAASAGLDPDRAREALNSDRYGPEVRAEEREAAELGIGGVPFFVIDRRYGVSGAQPSEILLQALRQAWDDSRRPLLAVSPAAAAAPGCEDGSCSI